MSRLIADDKEFMEASLDVVDENRFTAEIQKLQAAIADKRTRQDIMLIVANLVGIARGFILP